MGSKKKLLQTANKIDRDLSPKEERVPQIFIFFSFDLVGSTEFKNTQKKEWPEVFARFYESIIREMKAQSPNIKIWKYIGDEVLFYKKLNTRVDLFSSIPSAFEALTSSLKHLKNIPNETIKPLSIKATVWCAPVVIVRGELENSLVKKAQNIALSVVYEENNTLKDFIGPDIDTGFRISRYAEKEKLVVSADFAYLLLESVPPKNVNKNTLLQNLKIVSYEDLKGIWKDRYYPIIWYFKDWEKREEELDYDGPFRSKIINNICTEKWQDITVLKKIFSQLELIKDIEKLLALLNESEKSFESENKNNKLVAVIKDHDINCNDES